MPMDAAAVNITNGGIVMKKIGILLADGCEEIEALAVVDVMRRAKLEIQMISITGERMIHGSRKIQFLAEQLFEDDFLYPPVQHEQHV